MQTLSKAAWFNTGLSVLGLIGIGMFGYSIMQQTHIQTHMNQAMSTINESIASTGLKVKETSSALAPLEETTQALALIEQKEEKTVTDLSSMNDRLVKIADSEKSIINGLDTLNQTTKSVGSNLASVEAVQNQLLGINQSTAAISNQEAAQVTQLVQLTQTSIAELQQLNQKLYPLRLLP